MSPMYELTTRDGTIHNIDLRRIVAVEKSAEADCSTFQMDPADDDLVLDDDVADPLTEAWRVYGGDAIYRILPLPSVEHKFIDLRRISRTATARTGIVTAYTDPSDHSFSLHPSAGGPLLAAWRAFVDGEHTPPSARGRGGGGAGIASTSGRLEVERRAGGWPSRRRGLRGRRGRPRDRRALVRSHRRRRGCYRRPPRAG